MRSKPEGSGRIFNMLGKYESRWSREVHEVHIHTGSQSLTLKHEAHTRAMLADGAVVAARFMEGKAPGLYTMTELLEEQA